MNGIRYVFKVYTILTCFIQEKIKKIKNVHNLQETSLFPYNLNRNVFDVFFFKYSSTKIIKNYGYMTNITTLNSKDTTSKFGTLVKSILTVSFCFVI